MSADASKAELERFRFEIDAIDDEICALLEKRFAAVAHVCSAKSAQGSASPIRPAREFAILSRLARRPDRMISANLKVRLWRIIMSASTLSQAPVSIHLGPSVGRSVPLRLLIAEHYASIPVTVHASDTEAFAAVGEDQASLCMVEPESFWAQAFLDGITREARIIGCLPLLSSDGVPDLLVLGHSELERTGRDETIVIGIGRPDGAAASWRVIAGGCQVTAYRGFHQYTDKVKGSVDGSRIAGHIARLAEAQS